MNLSRRSRLSLCQFLDLFDRDSLVVLFDKYGLRTDDLSNQWGGTSVTAAVREAVLAASGEQIGNVFVGRVGIVERIDPAEALDPTAGLSQRQANMPASALLSTTQESNRGAEGGEKA